MNNSICSLREKIATNNHALRRGQSFEPSQIKQNSWIISLNVKYLVSHGLLLKLITNSTCMKNENHYLLLILTIIQVTVLRRRQFLIPYVTFIIDMVKYKNICRLLKTLQMNKNRKSSVFKEIKIISHSVKRWKGIKKKLVTFQSILIKL